MLKLNIEYDPDVENPSEYGGWKLISFNRRHSSYESADNYFSGVAAYGEPIPANIGIARKLEVGTAFVVSCYEHGGISWFLPGESVHASDRWDTSRLAGILIWQGKASDLAPDKRRESARAFLDEYTAWANGECYGYSLEDEDGTEIDSCYGFIGSEYMLNELEPLIAGRKYEVTGEAAYIAS